MLTGGGGVKFAKILLTSYVNAPLVPYSVIYLIINFNFNVNIIFRIYIKTTHSLQLTSNLTKTCFICDKKYNII